MKLPDFNRFTSPSAYAFSVVCYVVGYVVVRVLSFGRITHDEREEPGWTPVTRLPDGRIGLSESALGTIGLLALGVGFALLLGLVWIWLRIR